MPIDPEKLRSVDVNRKYGGPQPRGKPAPEPDALPIRGKHRSPKQAATTVARVEAYKKKHGCTYQKTFEDLYEDLGHQSDGALKTAFRRYRKQLKSK